MAGAFARGPSGGGGAFAFRYPDHLPPEQLQAGMKSGCIYRARFRVNAGDRREAFCTIAGLPHDVLIKGELQQNRALEGDTVAVQIQGLNYWFVVAKLAQQGAAAGAAAGDGAADLIARIRLATVQDTEKFTGGVPSDAPWAVQGSPEKALEVINALLQEQPAFRVTGGRGLRRRRSAHGAVGCPPWLVASAAASASAAALPPRLQLRHDGSSPELLLRPEAWQACWRPPGQGARPPRAQRQAVSRPSACACPLCTSPRGVVPRRQRPCARCPPPTRQGGGHPGEVAQEGARGGLPDGGRWAWASLNQSRGRTAPAACASSP
jgi:hypothetical protein